MLTKERNEVLCLIKDTVTERKITYFSPIFDGAEQHKAVSKTLLSLGEDSSTLRNADVISTDSFLMSPSTEFKAFAYKS